MIGERIHQRITDGARHLIFRRNILTLTLTTALHNFGLPNGPVATSRFERGATALQVNADPNNNSQPFERWDVGTVGVYDVDLLTRPDFGVMLDTMAASPKAFHGVRFFGAFTAGQTEQLMPAGGGTVWDDPDHAPPLLSSE